LNPSHSERRRRAAAIRAAVMAAILGTAVAMLVAR
jgi:hypothetical protein